MKKNNNKGFTLMEMLIVVAIIAVLVAIAIPVFTNQLEKSREATDAANIRSAYAEVMAAALTGAKQADVTGNNITVTGDEGAYTYSKHVAAVQKQKDWQNTSITDIAGITVANAAPADGKSYVSAANVSLGWNITYDTVNGTVSIENAAKGK